MHFEFDIKKSDDNKLKHGIDFFEAQALWEDPDFIEIPIKTGDERRYVVIGMTSGKHWTGVTTYRGDQIGIIPMERGISQRDKERSYFGKRQVFRRSTQPEGEKDWLGGDP